MSFIRTYGEQFENYNNNDLGAKPGDRDYVINRNSFKIELTYNISTNIRKIKVRLCNANRDIITLRNYVDELNVGNTSPVKVNLRSHSFEIIYNELHEIYENQNEEIIEWYYNTTRSILNFIKEQN